MFPAANRKGLVLILPVQLCICTYTVHGSKKIKNVFISKSFSLQVGHEILFFVCVCVKQR